MSDDDKKNIKQDDNTVTQDEPTAVIPNDLSEGSQDEDDSKTESADPSAVPQVLDSEVARTRRDDKEAAQDDTNVIPARFAKALARRVSETQLFEPEPQSRRPESSEEEAEVAEKSAKEEVAPGLTDAAVESVNSDLIDSTDTSDESDTRSPAESSVPEDPSLQAPQDDSKAPQDDVNEERKPVIASTEDPNAKWYVVHTFAGHENKVLTNLKQRVESEHLENRIFDILVPTQDKIEIRGGKKETVKEKIFPGYILVKMILDDNSWLTVRTTQGVTSFIGAGNKPIPISEAEVNSIVKFTTQGAAPTFKDVFMVDDTVKIVDGPFSDFIGKVESVDKEKGRVRVLVSIFGRETPVELDFLQVQKL